MYPYLEELTFRYSRKIVCGAVVGRRMGLLVCLLTLSLQPHVAAGAITQISYFNVGDHQAFILRPAGADVDTPWVWYAPTLVGTAPNPSNDWLFQQLIERGIAVAGIDVGESYGNPAGRAAYSKFYDYATRQANLSAKPLLLAQSRGGLMMYNWAVENAQKVSGIAGIYPVGDLRSYPGLERAAPAYGMTPQQLDEHLSENNPIDRLLPLVQAGIPIFHIHGDSDTTVPLDTNSQVIYDRYTALGGDMRLVVVNGKGHEEVPEFFESQQLLDFMVAHVCAPEPGTSALTVCGAIGIGIWGTLKGSGYLFRNGTGQRRKR